VTNSYRFDVRDEKQFKKDIELGVARERLAIALFKHYLKREHGFTGDIVENGCDMSGEFIPDISKVTAGADYLVGKNQFPIEVKTSATHSKIIYLKVQQIKSYVRQGASLLFVNGIEDDIPAFTFFTTKDLERIAQNAKKVFPVKANGGKESYLLAASDYEWRTFAGKEKKYGF